jgi:F0F1-type ATP synthase membrane subunit b/b'
MKEIFHLKIRSLLLLAVVILLQSSSYAQTANQATQPLTQEEMNHAPLLNQFNYIQEHTKIYENFRAIREDVFQRLKKNVSDTVTSLHKKVYSINSNTVRLSRTIDSLNTTLNSTKTSLDEMTRTKESMKLMGMEIEKGTYTRIMMSIIIALILILVVGFLVFKRNQNVVNSRNKDLADLKTEFEAYRKTSREAREKMAQQHFNELKRLRGE